MALAPTGTAAVAGQSKGNFLEIRTPYQVWCRCGKSGPEREGKEEVAALWEHLPAHSRALPAHSRAVPALGARHHRMWYLIPSKASTVL